MLGEPQPTHADLHFNVAGFPVRVHPFFWVISLLLGSRYFENEPVGTLLGVASVFVSILVHELGHAILQRRFGGRPWIVLHGFGGLAICGDCDRSPRSQILISLAGPLAGFILAVLLLVAILALSSEWAFGSSFGDGEVPSLRGWAFVGIGELAFSGTSNATTNKVLGFLLQINIVWGLMNLLPVYPLDGGQVAREVFTLGRDVRQGMIRSMQVSIGVAVAAAVYALVRTPTSFWMAILFGFLAYNNWQTLQAYTGRGPGPRWQ